MPASTITLACQDYDHTRALVDGVVTVEGFDLKVVTLSPPSQIFLRMLNKEEFDSSEMSLSNYMIALGHGDRRFVAIPVFPSRAFRHSYIWIHANAGIREPRDLIGKRVGIADYSMTALLFVRGMLKHEYNVLPEDIHWFRRRSEHVSIKAPATLRIDNIEKDQTLDGLLEEAGWMQWPSHRLRKASKADRASSGVSSPMQGKSKPSIIIERKSFQSCT